ncbi:MAG TPA: C25 family cysteine peptidase [Gemmataceae bacterium]|nr:C25 family cysteine peptidase [Gemmataceae bacterium]
MHVFPGRSGRFLIGLCFLCVFVANTSAWAAEAGQWIVATAPAFRKAVEPLCQQRKSQGLHVVVVQTTDVLSRDDIRAGQAHKLREHINKLCRDHKGPSYVLLVGAIEPGTVDEPENKVLPALAGAIGRMKGQPSDNGYGCLDNGRLPAAAVGRFPARTEEEARGMVAKTLEYERDARPALWRRRLLILAGIPAYNPLVDRMVESLALARLARFSPTWTGRAIYSNPQSRFCLPDDRLHQRALQYVQDGEAFTLYLGHSNAEGLYGGRARYLDRDDWSQLRIEQGKGVFVTFGCVGCQLKGEDGEGYGVAAMRNANGPAAVIGSHGICFAAMVQLAADGLFESTFAQAPPERLGDSWLAIKNGVAHGKIDDLTFGLLNAVDGDKTIPQATQRQEHLEMFLLLGDPALHLPRMPEDVELSVERSISPGEKVTVSGKLPARLAEARVRITLERTVNSLPEGLESMPKDPRSGNAVRERVMLANHERANRFVVAESESREKAGRFQATVDVPAKLPWPCLVLRVYAANEREEGMAVQTLHRSASNRR